MKNKGLFINISLLLFCFFTISKVTAQVDTLYIETRGDYKKKETYGLYYNTKKVLEFGDQKKYASTKIALDTIKNYQVINLSLYKTKKGRRTKYIKFYFIYDPNNPYLRLYHLQDKVKMKKIKGHFQVLYRPDSKYVLFYD